jgi:hypothetical protein
MTGGDRRNVQSRPLDPHPVAAAFEEDDVAPLPGYIAPDPLLDADLAEAGTLMEGEAGAVLGKYPGEERPDASFL